MDTEQIILIVLLAVFVGLIVKQHFDRCSKHNKDKEKYKEPKVKWTCGTEGGCFQTEHGTYDTKQQCEAQCGNR